MIAMPVVTPRPKLLDLFCGAGGAGYGLYEAGFDVTGVDLYPQKRYPRNEHMRFIQADAIEYALSHGWRYDAVWASPICQRHTNLKNLVVDKGAYLERHGDLIPHTRFVLESLDLPYIIENVVGARKALRNPIELCGCMFSGLKVYRARLFESSVFLYHPRHLPHHDTMPAISRGISPKGYISIGGNGGYGITDAQMEMLRQNGIDSANWNRHRYGHLAMQCEWVSRAELSQAIPPAYSNYLGRQLMQYVRQRSEVVCEHS